MGTAKRVKTVRRNIWHTRIVAKNEGWYREVVESSDRDSCKEFERFLIAEIGRRNLQKGSLVNLTDGGEATHGMRHSEASKARLRKTLAVVMKTEAVRRKVSMGLQGVPKTDAHCQALRAAKTPESRAKISARMTGKPKSSEHRAAISLAKRDLWWVTEISTKRAKQLNSKLAAELILAGTHKRGMR